MRAMRRVLQALAVTLLVGAGSLAAQQKSGWELAAGGGAGLPIGEFNDAFDAGWHATGAVSYMLSDLPLAFQVDATYAQYGDATPLDLKERLFYGTANLLYQFRLSQTVLEPYAIGGGGVYNIDPQGADAAGLSTKTKFGVNAGLGLMFRMTPVAGVFFESRFHDVIDGRGTKDMQFNNFTLGARFGM
jgi:Outer membrane protein beta-barrel domain